MKTVSILFGVLLAFCVACRLLSPAINRWIERIMFPPEETQDPDQAWYWTDEWQAGEAEVDKNIAAGNYETYDGINGFIDSLKD